MRKLAAMEIARSFPSLAVAVLVGISTIALPALSSDKPIDWNQKLEKERHLMATNNVEEAEKILEDFEKKHPEAGAVHSDMGKCLKKRGHYGEARAEFQRSTEVEPAYAEAWYELGAIQQSNKEYESAISSFEHYLQIAPYADNKDAVKDRINFCKSSM